MTNHIYCNLPSVQLCFNAWHGGVAIKYVNHIPKGEQLLVNRKMLP